jgi:hypothetical protein
MNLNAKLRIQRTYEVCLTDYDKTVKFQVNLAYDLNADGEAVEHGKVVEADDVRSELAAVNRLRRLAATGRADTNRDEIDRSDWNVRLLRQRLLLAR